MIDACRIVEAVCAAGKALGAGCLYYCDSRASEIRGVTVRCNGCTSLLGGARTQVPAGCLYYSRASACYLAK